MAEVLSVQIHAHSASVPASVFKTTTNTTNPSSDKSYDVTIEPVKLRDEEENTLFSNQFSQSNHLVSKQSPVSIQFTNIKYSVSAGRRKGLKAVLHGLSGDLQCGQLSAVMGPSGAGKSTLLNILTGYTSSKSIDGQIFVNGKERNLRIFRKMSCYIMQNNHLLPHLTVLEAMTYSASLKLSEKTSRATKQAVIEEILSTLGLLDARMTRTNKLSGGQQKRLSIALELINMPSVMFFDEPTSGLDSASCYQCVSVLKSLAQTGRTIVCTIHQPSAKIFYMFDQLYLLAEGHCMYAGAVTELVPYLSSFGLNCPAFHNPADYVMEVAAGEYGRMVPSLVKAMKTRMKGISSSDVNNSSSDETSSSQLNDDNKKTCCELGDGGESMYATSLPTQFLVLLKRTFISIIRDAALSRFRMMSHVVTAILIGILYLNMGNDSSKIFNNNSFVFSNAFILVFTALMPTAVTFPLEMSVLYHEHLNHWYGLKAFYFAKTLADIPFQIVFPAMFGCIVYWMTNQPFEFYRFAMFLTMCVQMSLIAHSQALLIASCTSVQVAVFAAPVTSIPIFLFSGFFVNFNGMPYYLRWLTYLSYLRYSFEGMMQAIYGYNREMFECNRIDEFEGRCIFRHPEHVLRQLNVESAKFHIDFIALCAYYVFLRICCYILLRYRTKVY